MAKRADWSRPLPQALVIPTVMTLKTLADVRELLRHLPEDRRAGRPGVTSPRSLIRRLPAPTQLMSRSPFAWR